MKTRGPLVVDPEGPDPSICPAGVARRRQHVGGAINKTNNAPISRLSSSHQHIWRGPLYVSDPVWCRCIIHLLEWTGASLNSGHWKTQTRLIKADEAASDTFFPPISSLNSIPWFAELFQNLRVKCLKTPGGINAPPPPDRLCAAVS